MRSRQMGVQKVSISRKTSKPLDIGFSWYRDWYCQYNNPYSAIRFVRTGQIICQPGTTRLLPKTVSLLTGLGFDVRRPGRRYVVVQVNRASRDIWLWPTDGQSDALRINARDLCFPGNILYALDVIKQEETAALEKAIREGALKRVTDIHKDRNGWVDSTALRDRADNGVDHG